MSRILLIGSNGQVGWELERALAPLGEVATPPRQVLELASPSAIRSALRTLRPAVIVNAAAYTAVDRAEEERALALKINAEAPGLLAEEARRLGALFVHYSTDYVFDGRKGSPYAEGDPPSPLNAYGLSKLAGERAVEAAGGRFLILRTSWVYGLRGRNFLLTVLRLAEEGRPLRIVDDQTGSPTWCRFIAEATARLIDKGAEGLYHLSASGQTTWHGFARAILEKKAPAALGRLTPIATSEYPTPARRPPYTVLDCRKVERDFGLHIPPWETQLRLALQGP